jgi:hypothetical protein
MEKTKQMSHPSIGRMVTGSTIFIFGFTVPLLTPLFIDTSLPAGWKMTIAGLMIFGIPELIMMIAVAIMGKSGFAFLKEKLYGLFRKVAPPGKVSSGRYRVGLVLFVLPLLTGWLLPYLNHLLPSYESYRLIINIAGDLLLVSSFFVLGGDFWDKLRGLFVNEAKITFETGDKFVHPD